MVTRKTPVERQAAQMDIAQRRLASAQKKLTKASNRVTRVRASAAPAEDAFTAAQAEVVSAEAYLEWVKNMPTSPVSTAADQEFTIAQVASASVNDEGDEVEDDEDDNDDDEYYDDEDVEDETPVSA